MCEGDSLFEFEKERESEELRWTLRVCVCESKIGGVSFCVCESERSIMGERDSERECP